MSPAEHNAAPSQQLRIQLLGPARIRRGEQDLGPAIKYRRTLALLAYLAIENRATHSREHLADLLWPQLPADAGKANLRQVLGNLGHLLSTAGVRSPGLQVTRHSVALDQHPALWIDVHLLDAAPAQICRKCTGLQCPLNPDERRLTDGLGQELLAGFSLPGCEAFAEWLDRQRSFFRQRSIDALHRLADCALEAGRMDDALDLGRRLETLDPLDELNQRRLMRAYAQHGLRERALRQFETFASLMQRELGVPPDTETALLQKSIAEGTLRVTRADERPLASAPSQHHPGTDEYRSLAVLCCECIAPCADPEDGVLHHRNLRRDVIECLTAYGGHAVSAPGQSLIAYFGWPVARDSAPADAVRAALALHRRFGAQAQVRIGLHWGRTISGETPDELGELSETASQLRLLALGGDTVISEHMTAVTGERFSYQPLNATHSGAVYRVTGITPSPVSADRSIMLGRGAEMTHLLAHWSETKAGNGRTVVISGEAGIGKSTLLAHFFRHALSNGGALRAFICRPELRLSPLAPLGGMIEERSGIGPDDPRAARRQKLLDYLQREWPDKVGTAFPLIVDLIDCDGEAMHNKEALFRLLIEMFNDLSSQQPVVLALEDAHWADATTLELIDRLALARLPIMTLVATREELPVRGHVSQASCIRLAPLDDGLAHTLLQALPATAALDAQARDELIRRAGGIPLYLHELATLAGARGHDGAFEDIPYTLQAVLRERIDRIGADAHVLRAAAVLGQRFEIDVLAEALGNHADLSPALERLEHNQLLVAEGDGNYRFTHALIRDAAYQSMTRVRRTALHLRVATVLTAVFPSVAEKRPEVVAWHATSGGDLRQGLFWWDKAGRLAARRQAATDAVAHYRNALQIAESHPELTSSATTMALMFDLGDALILSEGFGSLTARKLMERALDIAVRSDDSTGRFMALARLYQSDSSHCEHARGLETAQLLHDSATSNSERMFALFALGNSNFWRGNFATSRDALVRLHQLAERAPATERNWFGGRSWHGGDDVAVTGQSFLGLALWFLGEQAEAAGTLANARRLGAACGNEHSHCFALSFSALFERFRGNPAGAERYARMVRSLAERYGFTLWIGVGTLIEAWAQVHQGALAGSALEQGSATVHEAYRGGGVTVMSICAEAQLAMGHPQQALTLIERALLTAEDLAEQYYVAELLRLRAEILLQVHGEEQLATARSCLDQALELASRQLARPLIARILASQLRLDQSEAQGRLHDAHDAIADAG